MKAGWWGIALWLLAPAPAAAEWQVRPFLGFTFGGTTKFQDPERAIGSRNAMVGVSGGWLGEIFGLEGDFGLGPGFFQKDSAEDEAALVTMGADPDAKLVSSGVKTLTGNIVIALPKRMAGYGLRPYFSGGAGIMRVDLVGRLEIIDIHRTLPALSLGGGVTGFLTPDFGVNWDIRRLSTMRGEGETRGNSIGNEQLSFWRATMSFAVRY